MTRAAVFFGWLYGVPFLLVVGLLRRMSSPHLPTSAAAEAFGATTDRFLVAALVLNLVLPVAGLVLARSARDGYWIRHFVGALVGMVSIYLVVSIAAGATTAPLIGDVPTDQEPAPRVTQCIPRSGGTGCPGG
ncbi:hypothetical protein [Virgisporangium aurantiacum]|uniref:hypothetical protein n=1 Tax=Virgisporangium aurantiacum TaxID=175570 RepID=UPI00194F69BD|nr:hypothetical protein [Virgisporangium aurantiacum]